ncbi:MAG: CHAT domain-containing protein [Acaryochloridaceae cyanobacterium RL_2_7]|nr:CHAT domain-containing protein [Acaryochloridaceae cyanobacterium RL_2_7]
MSETSDSRALFMSLGQLRYAVYGKKLSVYSETSSLLAKHLNRDLVFNLARESLENLEKASGEKVDLIALQSQLLQWKLLNDIHAEFGDMGWSEVGYNSEKIDQLKHSILSKNIQNESPSLSVLQSQLEIAKQLLVSDSSPRLALSYAKSAWDGAQKVRSASMQSEALGMLGHIYEYQRQWQGATTLTERALSMAQAIQDPALMSKWQWQLGRIYKQKGLQAPALLAYQKSVDNLEVVRQNLLVIQNDVEFSFRKDIEPVYRQYVDLLLQRKEGQVLPQARLKQAIQIFDDFQVAELEDFLNCNLESRSRTQPDQESAFVYPMILGDRLQVIVQPPNQEPLVQYSVNLSEDQINKTLKSLRREQEQIYESPKGLELSQQVYDWILRPAESHLQQHQIKTLVFVLDGLLRNISIGALHDGEQYILEKGYSIALLPGLELFSSQGNNSSAFKALTFGLSQGTPPLPNVTQELKTIQDHFKSTQYLDQSFSHRTLSEQLLASSAPIVHLATHGQFSSNPDDTYLLTWDKKVSGDELSQLLQNRANSAYLDPIELLVLSACQTAKGDPRAILGLAGIAIQSGARSTLSSLWAVNDRSTTFVMSEFYRVLATSKSTKAEALRQAQIKLRQTPGYESPRYWGAYVLVGNWR